MFMDKMLETTFGDILEELHFVGWSRGAFLYNPTKHQVVKVVLEILNIDSSYNQLN